MTLIKTEAQPDKYLDLPEGVPPLSQFYLYLSTGCNLKCQHCWITPTFVNAQPSAQDIMDVGLLYEAVKEAKNLGLSTCKLTGGEPMLHPQFVEIVDMLSAENLSLSMETNGTLIDEAIAEHLKSKTNVRFIAVSIDGAKAETHDRFRGVRGAFHRALGGIQALVKAGYNNIQIIMSLHRGNIGEIESLLDLAQENGVASVKFNPVTAAGRGIAMHKRGQALDFDETYALIRYVRQDLQPKTSMRLNIMAPAALSSITELMREENIGTACGVRHVLGILGTGELALCGIGRTVPDLVYGYLGQNSIREVWLNHPKILQMRRDLDEYERYPGVCGRCVHAETCLTHCIAQNYLDHGKLVYPSQLCLEMDERGIFPTSRLKPVLNASSDK